jgi:hypothetical protein
VEVAIDEVPALLDPPGAGGVEAGVGEETEGAERCFIEGAGGIEAFFLLETAQGFGGFGTLDAVDVAEVELAGAKGFLDGAGEFIGAGEPWKQQERGDEEDTEQHRVNVVFFQTWVKQERAAM